MATKLHKAFIPCATNGRVAFGRDFPTVPIAFQYQPDKPDSYIRPEGTGYAVTLGAVDSFIAARVKGNAAATLKLERNIVRHELCHARHTDFTTGPAIVKDGLPFPLLNLFEDIRMEHADRGRGRWQWRGLLELPLITDRPEAVLLVWKTYSGVKYNGPAPAVTRGTALSVMFRYMERIRNAETTAALVPVMREWLKDFPAAAQQGIPGVRGTITPNGKPAAQGTPDAAAEDAAEQAAPGSGGAPAGSAPAAGANGDPGLDRTQAAALKAGAEMCEASVADGAAIVAAGEENADAVKTLADAAEKAAAAAEKAADAAAAAAPTAKDRDAADRFARAARASARMARDAADRAKDVASRTPENSDGYGMGKPVAGFHRGPYARREDVAKMRRIAAQLPAPVADDAVYGTSGSRINIRGLYSDAPLARYGGAGPAVRLTLIVDLTGSMQSQWLTGLQDVVVALATLPGIEVHTWFSRGENSTRVDRSAVWNVWPEDCGENLRRTFAAVDAAQDWSDLCVVITDGQVMDADVDAISYRNRGIALIAGTIRPRMWSTVQEEKFRGQFGRFIVADNAAQLVRLIIQDARRLVKS